MIGSENIGDHLLKLGLEEILASDEEIFRHFWQASPNPHYADSWAYVLQSVNGYHLGLSPLGYKAVGKHAILAVNVFHRPTDGVLAAHIVNPVGNDAPALTCRIATSLADALKVPVYIKNVRREVAHEIGNRLPDRLKQLEPWHPQAPLEDNTEPEIVLSVTESLGLLQSSSKNQVKDKYGRFARKTSSRSLQWKNLVPERQMDALQVVDHFFSRKRAHHTDISGPEDYRNMVIHSSSNNGFGGEGSQILYIDNEPVALLVIEGLARSRTAGVYCNLALYQDIHYLSEFVIIEACRRASANGYRYLNLGGSESPRLTEFKRKFQPVAENVLGEWLMII